MVLVVERAALGVPLLCSCPAAPLTLPFEAFALSQPLLLQAFHGPSYQQRPSARPANRDTGSINGVHAAGAAPLSIQQYPGAAGCLSFHHMAQCVVHALRSQHNILSMGPTRRHPTVQCRRSAVLEYQLHMGREPASVIMDTSINKYGLIARKTKKGP